MVDNDEIYEQVSDELDRAQVDEDLWGAALEESGGDVDSARRVYFILRMDRLSAEREQAERIKEEARRSKEEAERRAADAKISADFRRALRAPLVVLAVTLLVFVALWLFSWLTTR